MSDSTQFAYPTKPIALTLRQARKLHACSSRQMTAATVATLLGCKTGTTSMRDARCDLTVHGLIETASRGRLQLTGLADDILTLPAGQIRNALFAQAAFQPTLFADIRAEFPLGDNFSCAQLQRWLVDERVPYAEAELIASAYRGTVRFLQHHELCHQDHHG